MNHAELRHLVATLPTAGPGPVRGTSPHESTAPRGVDSWRAAAAAQLGLQLASLAAWLAACALLAAGLWGPSVDHAWLGGWLLAMATGLALGAAARWHAGAFAVRAVAGLRRALFDRLRSRNDAEPARAQALARALETEAMDVPTLGAVSDGLRALLECGVALLLWTVLGNGVQALLLMLALAAMAWLGRRHLGTRLASIRSRVALHALLIEQVRTSRTRSAQLHAGQGLQEADRALATYETRCASSDGDACRLLVVPRLLLMASALLLQLTDNGLDAVLALAVALLGAGALDRLARAALEAQGAWVAWLLAAESRPAAPGQAPTRLAPLDATAPLLEARELVVDSPAHGTSTGERLCLQVRRGDRVVLAAANADNADAIAALLAGSSTARSGLLMTQGASLCDLAPEQRLGLMALAPALERNHLFAATLAFNLLQARPLPHGPQDLDEAAEVCEELGLGPLLSRMPGGIHQFVGEAGWRLSDGELSRVLLARALLARPQLLVLDRPFAALDARTMSMCVRCIERRADTVLLICHP